MIKIDCEYFDVIPYLEIIIFVNGTSKCHSKNQFTYIFFSSANLVL